MLPLLSANCPLLMMLKVCTEEVRDTYLKGLVVILIG